MKVNIGTYSFGMRSPMSLEDKIKKAKEIGYDGVELLANDLQNNSTADIKKWLTENGMAFYDAHCSMEQVEEVLPMIKELGGFCATVAMHPFSNKAEALEVAKMLNAHGETAKKMGMKVGYHNHEYEFRMDEGKHILDYVIENTNPDTVVFKLDCGWAAAGGCEVVEYIKKYSGRFAFIHAKENNENIGVGDPRPLNAPRPARPPMQLDADGNPIMTEEMKKMFAMMRERTKVQCKMGDASSRIDWKAVREATEAQGIPCEWTVERENDYLDNIVECLKEDCAWLKSNLK